MRGFALIGVIVALSVLAVLGFSLANLLVGSQSGTIAAQYSSQGFYVSHAAFEYAARNTRALHVCSPTTRQFLSTDLGLTFTGKIYSSTSYGSNGTYAGNSFSISQPTVSPGPCIYVLSSSGSGAMTLSGNTNFTSTCIVNVNSSSSSALKLSNNSTMTVSKLNIVGSYSASSGAITGTINTGASAATDPFLAIPMITYGTTCDYTNKSVSSTTTLNPGVYCGGLTITGNGTTTFNPGNYIMDGGNVNIGGNGTVNASNVTIFLNSKIQSTYPSISVAGTVNFNLSAPTNGTYAGIAVYQSRSATATTNKINGSSGANVTGAIYLPNGDLTFTGSTASNAPCTLPISNTLTIGGPSSIKCMTGDLGGLIQPSC